jgi:subtilisin family serine protease
MSMSYMWVNIELGNYRGVYRCAHEHLSAAGIVAVGGAGNFARLPAGKQIALPKDIPCVIAAAGITEDGAKAQASSEGPCTWSGVKFYDDYPADKPLIKPDVTGLFTGYPMWARPNALGGRWQVVSRESPQAALVIGPAGNSFAGPHAAGVAALMLSANPDLCAWDVKRLMEATCRDLGPEGRDTTYGAGLLQTHAAVRAAREPFQQ